MTDQELRDLVAKIAQAQYRNDTIQAKNISRQDATDAKLDKVAKMLGGIGQSQGEVAQEYFYSSLRHQMQVGDIHFDKIMGHVKLGNKGKEREYDIILVNGQTIALVEIKYKLRSIDLTQISEQIAFYKEVMPEHEDFQVYAGVAAFAFDDNVEAEAQNAGYFILKRHGRQLQVNTDAMRVQ